MRVKLLDTWTSWIQLEQRKRLGLAIYVRRRHLVWLKGLIGLTRGP